MLQRVIERHAVLLGGRECLAVNLGPQPLDFFSREIAKLDGQIDLSGDHIRRAGLHQQPPHGAHLASLDGAHDPVDDQHQLGGGQHGVLATVHRGRPGVIREASQRHVVVMNSDDAFHDADVDAALVEDGALLDVQLDVSGDGAGAVARLDDPRRVSSDATDLFREDNTVAPGPFDFVRWQVPDEATAASQAAFLVAPNHDMQGVAVVVAAFGESVGDFDRGARSDVAIEIAAFRHRIDVRTEQNGERRALRSRANAENVSGRVDAGGQPGFLH